MPRSLITDDVIERLCPEYQPLAHPNAYFDNVGGMVRSEGIKATPIRPPPRPARIQYLSSSANIPLDRIRASVDGSQEIAQPVVNDLRVVERASAPPFEREMLAGMPPPFSTGVPPPTYQEAVEFGMPPPVYEELEEKGDIPYTLPRAIARTTIDQGDPSHDLEEKEGAIKEIADFLEEKSEMATSHIRDHTTPIEEGVEIKPYFAPRDVGLIKKRLQGEMEAIKREKRLQELEETLELGEESITRTAEELKKTEEELRLTERMGELSEESIRKTAEKIEELKQLRAQIQEEKRAEQLREDPFQQLVKRRVRIEGRERRAKEFTESGLTRGQLREISGELQRVSQEEKRGISGLSQPPREPRTAEEKVAIEVQKRMRARRARQPREPISLAGFTEEEKLEVEKRLRARQPREKIEKEILIAPREEQIKAQKELSGLGTRAIIKEEITKRRPQAKGQKLEKDVERRVEARKAKLRGSYNPFRTELR
jgi:hypothetical protein